MRSYFGPTVLFFEKGPAYRVSCPGPLVKAPRWRVPGPESYVNVLGPKYRVPGRGSHVPILLSESPVPVPLLRYAEI